MGSGWSAPRPGRFTHGKDTVPIAEAKWAPGSVWTGVENLAYAAIRSPDRPADLATNWTLNIIMVAV